MRHSAIITLILNIFCAYSQVPHETLYFVGCFLNDFEAELEVDGEEVFYIDFQRRNVQFTLPAFLAIIPLDIDRILRNALKNKRACSGVLALLTAEEKHPPEVKDPPASVIYTSEDAELGVENSLICFINHFYPPSIKVSWTKNGQLVTEKASLSRYYPNNDGTFHQLSTLTFTPREGDIYSCRVEHLALEEPITRTWEPNLSTPSPSHGLDVFCGVGLMVGLLGVAGGTFLIVKGRTMDTQ